MPNRIFVKNNIWGICLTAAVFLCVIFKAPVCAEDPLNAVDEPFFGMQVESASLSGGKVTVITTGAKYILSSSEMLLIRRIDPKTNSYSDRQVARLIFENDLGPLSIENVNKRTAVVESPKARFDFNSDSLFFITAKSTLAYTHENQISNVPWAKGTELNRFWTDGYGGSLMAHSTGQVMPGSFGLDYSKAEIQPGGQTAHMVFPTKLFDFEGLYGQDARPFVHFTSANGLQTYIAKGFDSLINAGFGVFVVWNSIYDCGNPDVEASFPVRLADGRMGYKVHDDYEGIVREFISKAHQNGFKILFYCTHSSRREWVFQDRDVTINFLWELRREYGFDGWYFDNADSGDFLQDYYFIRQMRSEMGDEGIIYHHDSVDVWGRWTGLKAVMVDCYVNYTLTGETARERFAVIDDPNDPYLRYYSAGYGITQAYSSHKRLSKKNLAISEEEKTWVMALLNGCERNFTTPWRNYFKPHYDIRKQEYLSGNFNCDVKWPVDAVSGWFRTSLNVSLSQDTPSSVIIKWETDEPSDSFMIYTSNGVWWKPDLIHYPQGPDGSISDARLVKKHEIKIDALDPLRHYQFRIRSSNKKAGAEEIIWGEIASLVLAEDARFSSHSNVFTLVNNLITLNKSEKADMYISLTEDVRLSVFIYDSRGRKVKTIYDDFTTERNHALNWDGHDENGRLVGSGIYIVNVKAGPINESKKIAVVK